MKPTSNKTHHYSHCITNNTHHCPNPLFNKPNSDKPNSNLNTHRQPSKTAYLLNLVLITAGVLGLASGTAYADIYKITKADGSVVYSDRATSAANSQVEVINLPPTTAPANLGSTNNYAQTASNSSSQPTNESSRGIDIGNIAGESSAIDYRLDIVTPANESAYHKPAQSIDIEARLSPALNAGDEVVIMIDGTEVARGLSASIPTIDLNPGQHTLTVKVMPIGPSKPVSSSRTFYVIQNIAIMRQKQQLAEQMEAYNKLPWYQKAWVKLAH